MVHSALPLTKRPNHILFRRDESRSGTAERIPTTSLTLNKLGSNPKCIYDHSWLEPMLVNPMIFPLRALELKPLELETRTEECRVSDIRSCASEAYTHSALNGS